MFRKLVSNVSFSPALVGQLSFYAKRLRKEEAIRRLGLIFTVLALVVQSFAVFSAPEPANAASGSDMIYGGIENKAELLEGYDRSKRFRDVMEYAGITRGELANTSVKYINNLDKGKGATSWKSWGWLPRFSQSEGEIKHDANGTTVYSRPNYLFNTSSYEKENGRQLKVLYGHSKEFGEFAIMFVCGNLIAPKLPAPEPPKPPAPPKPVASCTNLSIIRHNAASYRFKATAATKNGAVISKYVFTVKNSSGKTVHTVTSNSTQNTVTTKNLDFQPGNYTAEVAVHTNTGVKTSDNCQISFKVGQSGVTIDKQVRGTAIEAALEQARKYSPGPFQSCATVIVPAVHVKTGVRYTFTDNCLPDGWVAERDYKGNITAEWTKHTPVAINQPFSYRITVKNTGDSTLQNLTITDTAEAGVSLTSASKGNIASSSTWKYVIPSLAAGKSQTFTIRAKVTQYATSNTSQLRNKVCVDTPSLPGEEDDCADATVELPEKPIVVCELATDKLITINPSQFDETKHSKNREDCTKIQVCDIATGTVITIRKPAYDSKKHTRDLSQCDDIQVCNLETGKVEVIKRSEFDDSKHSEDAADCVPAIAQSKNAVNLSQSGVDATTVLAMSSDRIQYTITSHNMGEVAAKASFVENLDDVLEYATIVDNGGGQYDKETKTLTWPEVTLESGESQSRMFTVQLAADIPAGARGVSDQSSYDCIMLNTYGHATEIEVNCPAVKGVEQVVTELPTTGPGENALFAGVLLTVVTYFYARARQVKQEVRLIRRDLNAGTI